MKVQLLAGLLMLFSQMGRADAPSDQLHGKFVLQVPYGTSYFDYKLAQPTAMNPIRVLYTVSPSCPQIPLTGVSVVYEGATVWTPVQLGADGYFSHSDQKVAMIRFNMSQTVYRTEQCEMLVLTKLKEQKAVYAGVFSYEGGFSRNQELQLSQSFTSSKIKFDIPEFCRDIELQNVSLKNDAGMLSALKKTAPDTFELSKEQSFNGLLLTLNGPKKSCDIPVYVYEAVK